MIYSRVDIDAFAPRDEVDTAPIGLINPSAFPTICCRFGNTIRIYFIPMRQTLMQLHVQQADWGDARLNDIETLLNDTASHLNRLLRTPFQGTICVRAFTTG